jgi:hypothetical protein
MIIRIISDDQNQDEDDRHDRTDDKQQLRLPSSSTKLIDRTQLHRPRSIRYRQYQSTGTAADRNVGYFYITSSIVTIGCVTQPTIQGITTRICRLSHKRPLRFSISLVVHIL